MYGDKIPRDHRGRFRRGKPGGPGRPYGSLTKIKAPLGFLRDAVANWELVSFVSDRNCSLIRLRNARSE